MRGNSMHENREVPGTSVTNPVADRSGKACGRKPDMYVSGKSDIGIVPRNAANNTQTESR